MNKSQLIIFLWKDSGLSFTSFAHTLGVSAQLLRKALEPLKTKASDTNLSLLEYAFARGYAAEAHAFIHAGSRKERQFKPRKIPKKHEKYSFMSQRPATVLHVRVISRGNKIYRLKEGFGKSQTRSKDGCFRSV